MSSDFQGVVEWKRRFLYSTKYTSVDELLDDAEEDGPARTYVAMALGLRRKAANRKTIDELIRLRRVVAGNNWLKKFSQTLWIVYNAERELCDHRVVIDESGMESTTKRQRNVLAGTGLVRARREPMEKRVDRAKLRLQETLKGKIAVVWMDNFNKQRFTKNPDHVKNACVNGTVFAVTPQPLEVLDQYHGWPVLRQLCMSIDPAVDFLTRQLASFADDIRTLQLKALTYDQVRVPCDLRRVVAEPAPWYPWDIIEANVGSSPGVITALRHVLQLKDPVHGSLAILADVNIFYRIVKAMYSNTHVHLNIRGALCNRPLIFGLWHSYAHCVKKTFARFKSFWAFVEYGDMQFQPLGVQVYNFPALVTLEHTVVGIFLAAGKVKSKLKHLIDDLSKRNFFKCDDSSQLKLNLALSLQRFIEQYIPALMELGIAVRELYWTHRDQDTGMAARMLMARCLGFLLSMNPSGSREYQRGLVLGVLLWSRFHSKLAGYCFVEECLESSLSRLARAAGPGCTTATVQEFAAKYLTLKQTANSEPRKAGIARTYPHKVAMRLEKLVQRIKEGTVPHVPKTVKTEAKSSPSMAWPSADADPPHNLWTPLPAAVFETVVYRTVLNLVNSKSVAECRQDEEAELVKLCVDVPSLTPDEVTKKQEAIDMAKDILRQKVAMARRSEVTRKRKREVDAEESEEESLGAPCPIPEVDVAVDESSQDEEENEIDERDAPSVGSQDSDNPSVPSSIASSDAPSFASTLYGDILYSDSEEEQPSHHKRISFHIILTVRIDLCGFAVRKFG